MFAITFVIRSIVIIYRIFLVGVLSNFNRFIGNLAKIKLQMNNFLFSFVKVPWDDETGRYEPELYMNTTEFRQIYPHLKVKRVNTNGISHDIHTNC